MKTAKPQNMVICCQRCVKTWDFEAHFFPGEYSLACLLFVYEIYKGVLRSRMAWKERNNHLKDFSLQSDKIFPYLLLGLLSSSILRLLRPFLSELILSWKLLLHLWGLLKYTLIKNGEKGREKTTWIIFANHTHERYHYKSVDHSMNLQTFLPLSHPPGI